MADTDSSFTGFPIATRETDDITATQAMDAIKGVALTGLSQTEVTDIFNRSVDGQYVMTEAQAAAIWAQNQEKYAASDFVHSGKHYNTGDNHTEVNEGLWTNLGISNILALGDAAGRAGVSKTSLAALHVAGVIAELRAMNNSGDATSVLLLPEAPDGTVTYDSADGTVTQHVDAATAFAAETATNKVVTDRVDLVGLEIWDEEITDDEVFPFTIQNQSTTFGDTGVPTVLSSRVDDYFRAHDDQTSIDKGYCVNWSTLTETQKRKVAEYLGESFYTGENGLLVQRRVRQRSIAGAGNGDWKATDSSKDSTNNGSYLRFDDETKPLAQGAADTVTALTTAGTIHYVSAGSIYNNTSSVEKGVWIARDEASVNAYKGRCWFYVIATVPRLNQGAYHPSFNELGASRFAVANTGSGVINSFRDWNQAFEDGINPTSKLDCFRELNNGDAIQAGRHIGTGYLSSAQSGHPDGLYYDAIYASGQGGVRDYRHPLGAWRTTSEQSWEKLLDVYNGSYRGEEKLAFTKVGTVTTTGSVFSDGYTKLIGSGQRYSSDFAEWDGYQLTLQPWDIEGSFILGDDGTVYPLGHIDLQVDADSGCYVSKSAGNVAANFTGGTYDVVILRKDWLNLSVSGEFTQTDVIGNPANILLTDALKDGWLGSWIPAIPDGTSKQFPLTRKLLGTSTIGGVYSDDTGATWTVGITTVDTINNLFPSSAVAVPSGRVQTVEYKANAKQTKQSSNKVVKWGKDSLGEVWTYNWHTASQGAVTAESLLGIIIKNNAVGTQGNNAPLISYGMQAGKLLGASEPYIELPKHPALTLTTPNNDSSAIKVLPYIFEENGQINLGFIANELKHDGTDWGDDSTVKVIEDGTYTNDNAETCKAVIHELAIPLGWERNEV